MEKIKLPKEHYLRLRAVYYDDKHCTHYAYIDYIYNRNTDKSTIISPKELHSLLFKTFVEEKDRPMNLPDWDVLYIEASLGSDSFQFDHKNYYKPYMQDFERGMERDDSRLCNLTFRK
jgi:hypothetical protein